MFHIIRNKIAAIPNHSKLLKAIAITDKENTSAIPFSLKLFDFNKDILSVHNFQRLSVKYFDSN